MNSAYHVIVQSKRLGSKITDDLGMTVNHTLYCQLGLQLGLTQQNKGVRANQVTWPGLQVMWLADGVMWLAVDSVEDLLTNVIWDVWRTQEGLKIKGMDYNQIFSNSFNLYKIMVQNCTGQTFHTTFFCQWSKLFWFITLFRRIQYY